MHDEAIMFGIYMAGIVAIVWALAWFLKRM